MITITSTTLLDGLKDHGNAPVWGEFCARYQPVLISFARRLGLGEHDAQDAAQESLIAFATAYREGKYNRDKGRLRSWLLTIAKNKVRDLQRKQAHDPLRDGDLEGSAVLERVPDEHAMDKVWEAEWNQAVVRQCMEEVAREVEPTTMQAFRMLAVEGLTADEVALRLSISRNSVYLAKSRVLSRMRQLEKELDSDW